MFFIKASACVFEHLIIQEFNDVVYSFTVNRRFLRATKKESRYIYIVQLPKLSILHANTGADTGQNLYR